LKRLFCIGSACLFGLVILSILNVSSLHHHLLRLPNNFAMSSSSSIPTSGLHGIAGILANTTSLFKRASSTSFSSVKTVVVMGNEAADLDSVVTAIAFAVASQLVDRSEPLLFLPVINVPRIEYNIHTESVFVLSRQGITANELIFVDDVPWKELIESNSLQYVILTDHNRLIPTQSFLSPFVRFVFDHHADETLHLPNLVAKMIEITGSCCSLVGQSLFQTPQSLSPLIPDSMTVSSLSIDRDDQNIRLVRRQVAEMLLAGVLIDTSNFRPEAKKTTERDISVASILSEIVWGGQKGERVRDGDGEEGKTIGVDEKDLYDQVFQAKTDISSLTSVDLLLKDYKQWDFFEASTQRTSVRSFGIASVLLSLRQWSLRDPILCESFFQLVHLKKINVLPLPFLPLS